MQHELSISSNLVRHRTASESTRIIKIILDKMPTQGRSTVLVFSKDQVFRNGRSVDIRLEEGHRMVVERLSMNSAACRCYYFESCMGVGCM